MKKSAIICRALIEQEEKSGEASVPESDRLLVRKLTRNVVRGGVAGGVPTTTYKTLREYLGKRTRKKAGRHTYIIDRGDFIAVRYYSTDVVKAFPNGSIKVCGGGWINSYSTRQRINSWLSGGWNIYRHNNRCYWYNRKTRAGCYDDPLRCLFPFTNEDKILADGTLVPQAEMIVRKTPGNT